MIVERLESGETERKHVRKKIDRGREHVREMVDDDELAFWSVFLMCFMLDDSQGFVV